jgi:hypothetical protein
MSALPPKADMDQHVPQVPFTLEFPGDINTPNPLSALAEPRLTTIFTVLKPLVDNARNNIVEHARQRLQPKAVALAQRVAVVAWSTS